MTPAHRPSRLASLFAASLLPALAAHATSFTWTGDVDTNWAVNGNWNQTGFPAGTGDTAAITSAATVDLNGPQSAAQLTISANYAVTVDNSGAGALTLGVFGGAAASSFTRSTGSAATSINAPLVLAGRSIDGASFSVAGSGDLTFNGAVDMTAAKVDGNQRFVLLASNTTATVSFNAVVNFGEIGTRQWIFPANGEIWFNADNHNISNTSANNGFFLKPGNTSSGAEGTVVLGHNNALGTSRITFGENDNNQSSTRTVRLALAAEGMSVSNTITMRGEGSGMAVGGIHAAGIATYTGSIQVTSLANPGRFFSDSAAATTRFSGLIWSSSNGMVVIQGTGTVDFARPAGNTYAAGTTVTSGTLLVNNTSGSGTGSGAVTVKNGAILGGIGIITGNTTIEAGGILSPGNSIGTLTFGGDVDLDGILLAEYNSAGDADLLAVGGLLDLDGGILRLSHLGGGRIDHNQPYIIASYGSLAGSFATIQGAYLSIDYNYLDGNQIAVFIPEPTSLALLGLAVAATVNRRSRRRG